MSDPVRSGWGRAVLAVVLRPRLWATGAHQALTLAEPGWWRRWPPLPVPDRDYLRFRMTTQYGTVPDGPDAADLVSYLEWCRVVRRLPGGP